MRKRQAAAAHHAARTGPRTAVAPRWASSAIPGATQTQWWSQLSGDTSRPVRAQASMAGTGCRARYSSAAATSPAIAIRMAAAIQGTVPSETLPASRVSTPRSDWLPLVPRKTIRLAFRNSPCAQYVPESRGRSA